MVLLRCRTFLFCLPLAPGVCLLSLLGMLLGISGAVGSWMEVFLLKQHPNTVEDVIALFAQAISFSAYGLFSLIGVITGLAKIRTLAYIYPRLITIHYIIMIATFSFGMYYTFRPADAIAVERCIAGDKAAFIQDFCHKGFNLIKALPIGWYVLALVIQPYAYIIAVNLAEQLEIDDIAKLPKKFRLASDAASFHSKDVETGLASRPSFLGSWRS
ncbi:hypothetical protein CYLTODRAFT_492445 [Cylindrobasidium torrendii FP15055 ss-10]|uniref:Uncharacterized protein n=1 Tax=Cylindrobasidium torrendii FP15055 ss-10 TaxID=1314674 RepID=A0A0D7B516_9AGAR|nr:hypothetical protein CYLTODRAFT_492445 [Cylindrobasidium torrendii FP15055 ss-10]